MTHYPKELHNYIVKRQENYKMKDNNNKTHTVNKYLHVTNTLDCQCYQINIYKITHYNNPNAFQKFCRAEVNPKL